MSKDTVKETVDKLKSSTDGKRHYELSFHIVATIDEEGAKKNFDQISEFVTKTGANIINQSSPAKIDLRYQMYKNVDSVKQRHNSAYFAWIVFEGEADKVEDIKESLDSNNEILRYLIVTTESSEGKSSEEVAEMLKPVIEKEPKSYKEKKAEREAEEAEKANEDAKEDSDSEETTEKNENQDSEKANEEKVDEAIDELIKE